MRMWKLIWAPEGKEIGVVRARTPQAARKKAGKPYTKYLGEIGVEDVTPMLTFKVEMRRESVEYATLYIKAETKVEALLKANQVEDVPWGKDQVEFCAAADATPIDSNSPELDGQDVI